MAVSAGYDFVARTETRLGPLTQIYRPRSIVAAEERSRSLRPHRRDMEPRTLGDRLLRAADASFVGRHAELGVLGKVLHAADPGFVVAFVHGPY